MTDLDSLTSLLTMVTFGLISMIPGGRRQALP